RTAEQDRDAAGARVGVDVGNVGLLDVAGVQPDDAGVHVVVDLDPVQTEQAGDDLDILDLRHVAQLGGFLTQQRRDHRLGDEVLRTPDADLPRQRDTAVDLQY